MIKKIALTFFIFFILIGSFYAVIQGPLGQGFIRNAIVTNLKQSGLDVEIGKVEGTLPHQIELKNVSLKGKDLNISIGKLSLRPILWRLLKNELAFGRVFAKDIEISNGTPFDFDGKLRINSKKLYLVGSIDNWSILGELNRKTLEAQFTARNKEYLFLKGSALLNPNYELISSHIHMESEQLLPRLPFEAKGRILADANITPLTDGYEAKLTWQIPNLTIEDKHGEIIEGSGVATYANKKFDAHFIIGPYAKAAINLNILPDRTLDGWGQFDIENLQSLHLPNLFGEAHGKITWNPQNTEMNVEGSNLYYDTFFAQTATFSTNFDGFDLKIKNGKWKDLEINQAILQGNVDNGAYPFQMSAEGKLKEPFDLEVSGNKNEITTLVGTVFNHPVTLLHPASLNFNNTKWDVAIGSGSALFKLKKDDMETRVTLQTNELPLDFLAIDPIEIPITGTLTLKGEVQEQKGVLTGGLFATISNMSPFNANGTIEGHIEKDRLFLKGNLNALKRPLADFDITAPVHFSLSPFDIHFNLHKPVKAHITVDTQIENFLDFLNISSHHIAGHLSGNIHLSETLNDPVISGGLSLKSGVYENYYTGTKFQNIESEISANRNGFLIRSFLAQDETNTGTLSAKGEIKILPTQMFPFNLDVELTNLNFAGIDLVTSSSNGNIHIEGNALSALAKGRLELVHTELSIPDHIPTPPPELQVTYRNSIQPTTPPESNYTPYPLFLDLDVTTPQAVKISGRGVDSEWGGEFHLGGTFTNIAAKGKLELINGNFTFSDRVFKLTDGSLSLSGIEHEMPYLNIAAITETKGISIVARLEGPLDDPQITLQSSPPLPLSSIMSYLLFGQDLSEISGFQALEIASSIASLAGTGPGVMESTRKALGIDRIRIVSQADGADGETIALQVGKYVTEGVLVSFTQGPLDSAPNISVEVELKNNFVFQIESDQYQEQGKFTLKWKLNY